MSSLDIDVAPFVSDAWERALPILEEYIAIPARSPLFDPRWAEHGHIDRAARLLADWARSQDLPGITVEIVAPEGLTPVVVVEVPASVASLADRTIVMYGHLDKQPEFEPWSPGLGPWQPVRRGDRLYGRGGADDGYSIFSALIALAAVRQDGGSHARCVVLIEASEESSSVHLADHLDALMDRIGSADLIIALDSFCETYDRLWTTTSTRGVWGGVVDIDVCDGDPHSGRASGVLPSAFRIARQLLDRIEDAASGEVLVRSAHVDIPRNRRDEASRAAATFPPLSSSFDPVPGLRPVPADAAAELLAGTWSPALEVIGVDGLPPVADAGNVFRSRLRLKLSLRLPPTAVVEAVGADVVTLLEADPPYGAAVSVRPTALGPGWEAPVTAPWLERATAAASQRHFGSPVASCGVGGTIPFMGLLGARLPDAQFLLVGVLGPGSNAHGPDEFLHLPTVERVTACVADVVEAHAREHGRSS